MTRTFTTRRLHTWLRQTALAVIPMVALAAASPALADSERSREYLEDAMEWLQKGDGQAALIQLRNAIKEDPKNYAARLLLGRLYLEVGNIPAGRKELEQAHQGRPTDESETFLGRAQLAMRDYEALLETVRETADDAGYIPLKVLLRSEALFNLNRLPDAADQIGTILKDTSDHPAANVMMARIKQKQGDILGAHQSIDAALKGDPNFLEAYLLRANLAYAARDMDKVLEVLDRAAEISPNDPRPKLLRSEALLHVGKLEEALEIARGYQKIRSDDFRATFLMARIFTTRGDYQSADTELRKISEAVRQVPSATLLLGVVKFQLEQYAQAEEALSRYISALPAQAGQARRLLATIQMRTLRPRAALQTLQTMVGQNSRDIASMQLAASASLRIGDLNAAKDLFGRIARYGSPADIRQARVFHTALSSAKEDVTGKLMMPLLPLRTLGILDMLRHGEEANALSEAQKLAEDNPEDDALANVLAGIYIGRGDLESARKHAEAAYERDPTRDTTIRTLDRIDVAEGKFDAVEARRRQGVEANPDDQRLILRLAEFLSQRGRRDEALALLEDKTRTLPNAVVLNRTLIRLYIALKDAEATRKWANHALTVGRAGNVQSLELAGDTFQNIRDFPMSIEIYSELAEKLEDNPAALRKLAGAHYSHGQYPEAVELLERIVADHPNDVEAFRSLVIVNLRRQDADAAMAAANRAGEANPPVGFRLRAEIFRQTNRSDRAIQEIRAGLVQHPSSEMVEAAFRMMIDAEQRDEAEELLTSWLTERPDDPTALQLLSAAFIEKADYQSAAIHLERAFALIPNHPVVLNNLAWVRYELDRPGALAVARRAYRLAPNSPAIADTLGWILVREGQLEDGLKLLFSANNGAPNIGEIAYHLAFALNEVGRKDEARDVLDRVFTEGSEVKFQQDEYSGKAKSLHDKLKAG